MRHEWVKYKNDAGHSPHGISSVKLHCWKYFGMTDSLDDPFALASLCESAGNEAIEQRRNKLTASFAIADVQAATWQVTAIPLKINSAWNPNLNVFSIATCRLTRTHMYCTVQYPVLRLHICISDRVTMCLKVVGWWHVDRD